MYSPVTSNTVENGGTANTVSVKLILKIMSNGAIKNNVIHNIGPIDT
jgi:hypothetical protein